MLLFGSVSVATAGCVATVPKRPVPGPEAQRPLPGWYPMNAWNVGDSAERILVRGKVVFDTAKHNVREPSGTVLHELYDFLEANQDISRIRLEGHTDSRAGEEYNQGLSERRAISVANWLVDRGLDHNRILAVAFGELKPTARNDNAVGRQENRRVSFAISEIGGFPLEAGDPAKGGYVLIVLSKEERDRLKEIGEIPDAELPADKPERDIIERYKKTRAAAKFKENMAELAVGAGAPNISGAVPTPAPPPAPDPAPSLPPAPSE